ncbi:MAG TPA: hypothetical protein VND93_20135, partial [Myxococcales bacterium]|nr:hypothetical protein [Myxococcales bacterium]
MRPASWLALTSGVVLGGLAACFTSPGLSGPYRCGRDGGCPNPLYICRDELCCDPVSGDPPCPPEPPDGGEGDGGGGGCVIPNPPDCTVPNTFGPCRAGLWSCDGGTRHCEQLVQPGVESCTGQDENCNGVVNEFPPCGGPNDLLAPSGDFVLGGQRTSGSVQSQPTFCVKDRSGNTPDYFDGPVWRGVGGTTHFVYAEAADGGTWDLSGPNQSFHYTFAGTLVRPDSTP